MYTKNMKVTLRSAETREVLFESTLGEQMDRELCVDRDVRKAALVMFHDWEDGYDVVSVPAGNNTYLELG